MKLYDRVVHGAEAGALSALSVEASFFVLDLVRLEPLATPAALSGASLGPGGCAVELGSLSGVIGALWATYQVLTLTFTHLLAFAVAGVLCSLLFDWSRPGRPARILFAALLCTAAFFATVAVSGSTVAIDTVGTGWILGMSALGAVVMAAGLRFVASAPDGSTEEG